MSEKEVSESTTVITSTCFAWGDWQLVMKTHNERIPNYQLRRRGEVIHSFRDKDDLNVLSVLLKVVLQE